MNLEISSKISELFACPECAGGFTVSEELLKCVECDGEIRVKNGVLLFHDDKSDYDLHWAQSGNRKVAANENKEKQAEEFVSFACEGFSGDQTSILLDLGCGDGNHIPFLQEKGIVIAVDYSDAVFAVAERFGELYPNLIIVKGDALNLPLRDNVVDSVMSYGCFNVTGAEQECINEASRIVKPGGHLTLWGYGSRNPVLRYSVSMVRWFYKHLPGEKLKSAFVGALVPVLNIVENSTGINTKNSTKEECREIVSTNLEPDCLRILHQNWHEIWSIPGDWEASYDLPFGCRIKIK